MKTVKEREGKQALPSVQEETICVLIEEGACLDRDVFKSETVCTEDMKMSVCSASQRSLKIARRPEVSADGHSITENGDVTVLFYDINICNSPKMTYSITTSRG